MQLSTMITIVLGFSTCVSPALVALINNRHARELRKIELEASKSLKKIELNAELSKCFVLSDRDLKYKVASHNHFDYNNIDLYSKLISAHSECIAIGFSWGDFEGYMQYVKPPNENFSLTDHAIEQMQYSLTSISKKFNDLLIHSLNSALIE